MDNIETYVEKYRTFDEPVPFKDVLIYPVKVKDYYRFMSNIDILKIDKDKIPDVRVMQMSYLTFILGIIIESEEYRDMFINILELCLHITQDDECYNQKFPYKEILYGTIDNKEIYFINGYDVNIEFDGKSSILNIGTTRLYAQDLE